MAKSSSRKKSSIVWLYQSALKKFGTPDAMFNTLHTALWYGFFPSVVLIGMNMEPKPDWFELFNVFT